MASKKSKGSGWVKFDADASFLALPSKETKSTVRAGENYRAKLQGQPLTFTERGYIDLVGAQSETVKLERIGDKSPGGIKGNTVKTLAPAVALSWFEGFACGYVAGAAEPEQSETAPEPTNRLAEPTANGKS